MYDIEDITEEKQEFVIDTDTKADWAINIIKQEQAEKERLVNILDEEIEILKNKRERILNTDKTTNLKGKLADYFESIAEENKRDLKTCTKYKLANGELVFTKPQIKYERDNDKIISYLTAHNLYDYIKTNPSVDWEKLKKTDFFHLVDGVTEITTEPKFEIK